MYDRTAEQVNEPEPSRTGAVELLERELGALQGVIELLEMRLDPVLTPESDMEAKRVLVQEVGPLRSGISELVDSLYIKRSRLEQILRRIEV